MTCCGSIVEITSMSDPMPVFLCQQCGRQGPASRFPDPPEEPVDLPGDDTSFRGRAASFLARLAIKISRS